MTLEMMNSSEEEFEHGNGWLGDTGESTHMTMVHSGFKSLVKGKVKTCFTVDGDAVEMEGKALCDNRERAV